MKKILAGLSVLTLLTVSAQAQLYNNEPEGECLTNWCEIVHCPNGAMFFSNVMIWPDSPICLGASIFTSGEGDITSDQGKSVSYWAPETTNCPPIYFTNIFYPVILTNWWEISGPGVSDSGQYLGTIFTPTNCGQFSITFHCIWTNINPCTYEPGCGGGSASISGQFMVVNVEIAEKEKTICVCDTTGFSLTNSCGAVTWEVSPDEPGGPHASGSSIIAGTNCGTWTIIARSTIDTNCIGSASLTVVKVASIAPDSGLQVANNPDTYLVPVCTNFIIVTATPCLSIVESNLPPCWQMTGGLAYTNTDGTISRTKRQVDAREIGVHTIMATAGCSSNTVKIIVYRAKVEIGVLCANDLPTGHVWWNLSVEPSDVIPYLKKIDGTVLSGALGRHGFYPQGEVDSFGCGDGSVKDDSNSTPTSSYWWCISFGSLIHALTYAYDLAHSPGQWCALSNNCTTQAGQVANAAGVAIDTGTIPCWLEDLFDDLINPPSCECTP